MTVYFQPGVVDRGVESKKARLLRSALDPAGDITGKSQERPRLQAFRSAGKRFPERRVTTGEKEDLHAAASGAFRHETSLADPRVVQDEDSARGNPFRE